MTDFTFYYGAAAGSERKALQKMEEPNVMINYATQNNKPWPEIQNLFVDSGGYSFIHGKGDYQTTNQEYLDYIEEHQPELFALRDYPCEPEILQKHNTTVEEHQTRTLEHHIDLLTKIGKRDIRGDPVAVLQGWRLKDYLNHIEDYRDEGVLDRVNRVAIGSICRRNHDAEIARIIHRIHNELPDHDLHAFGVKTTILENPSVVEALTSSDSLAYSYACRREQDRSDNWLEKAYHYLHFKRQIEERLNYIDESQTQLQLVGEDRAGGEQA